MRLSSAYVPEALEDPDSQSIEVEHLGLLAKREFKSDEVRIEEIRIPKASKGKKYYT